VVRIAFAGLTFLIGLHSTGLLVAHLASLSLTVLLSIRLLGRYYDVRLLARAPISTALARDLTLTGLGLLPSALSTRALIDAPPVMLNLMLPGAQGAAAAGLFEIGRKLSTVPQIVRQAFQYVLSPLASAQARADRSAIGTLYHFASRVSTALVVPLAGLMIFAGPDVLSVYRKEAAPALAILVVLATSRALEAIVGPATAIVEMIGHRLLPLLNSALSVGIWLALAFWLAPGQGAWGMALAVAAATVAPTYAATIELRISDGVSPFDRKLFQGLGIALIGLAAMASAVWLLHGPVRFAALMLIWPVTSWFTLRYGLTREDREGLGGFARKLRLI
jgi:O-antigen/teichoic acid export membrane protein